MIGDERLRRLPKVERVYPAPFFHEFTLELPRPAGEVVRRMLWKDGILAGYDLGRVDPAWKNRLLVAVTEKRTKVEMGRYCDALARAL